MKKMKVMKSGMLALAAAMTVGGMTATGVAQAGTSATVSAANMYLWRGTNLTKDGAQVAGSLDYAHDSGLYVGAWTTTETGGTETDLYAGFGGSVGKFSYDISYWKYLYPEDCSGTPSTCDLGDNDLSEYAVSLGFEPVTFTYYANAESGKPDNNYMTLDVALGKFNIQYGVWDNEVTASDPTPNDYSHVTVSYAATDELSFAISKASNDGGYDNNTSSAFGVEEDPLFQVMYSKTFDL